MRPTIAGAFADVKDLRGGASFTAKVRDRAIKGMILVGIGEKGGAITVVFDSADAPQRNLAALAAAAQPQPELKWDDAHLPDGSGTMKLPTGWRITGAANGAVDVVGPEGQSIELGLAYPVVTPEADRAFKQQQIALGIRPAPSVVPVAAFPAVPGGRWRRWCRSSPAWRKARAGRRFRWSKLLERRRCREVIRHLSTRSLPSAKGIRQRGGLTASHWSLLLRPGLGNGFITRRT